MKGTYFLGADRETKFEVREMKPGPLGSEEVLVKNYSCGICGTDVHIYHGEEGSAAVNPPVVLGHEFSGGLKSRRSCGHRPQYLLPAVHSLPYGKKAEL